MRVFDLILGTSDDLVRLTDHQEEAVGRLQVMQEECQETDAELKAMWSSVARVQDPVLKVSDGTSSLAVSLSSVANLIEGRVDTAAAYGTH
jgi:hypothetical protein